MQWRLFTCWQTLIPSKLLLMLWSIGIQTRMKQFIWSRLWSFYSFWHYILYLLLSTFVISVDRGKMLLVLAQLELSGVRPWIFLHFDVWIRLSTSLLQVLVNLLLGTSRQLQNVWLMNLLMLQRDHQTGNRGLDYLLFTHTSNDILGDLLLSAVL